VGLLLMTRIGPGAGYVAVILPGVALFGLGLAITVAPLTATVLGSVETSHVGVGSGVNNAVARIAGLFAVALLPLVANVKGLSNAAFDAGFGRAMWISAAACVLGGAVSAAGIGAPRRAARRHFTTPDLLHTCVHHIEEETAA
nr:MFS transporter [Actinomycetota bacterium]